MKTVVRVEGGGGAAAAWPGHSEGTKQQGYSAAFYAIDWPGYWRNSLSSVSISQERQLTGQNLHNEGSRSITTFTRHRGLFRYKRLPFGINLASEVFRRRCS